ncbi:MAG: EAL domain-containing protein [Sterolibacterium sp.]|jgi:diguanylate cyclase (GGDEF)-like protein/PAS domain S-box-containing protein|nr:EAL domain-containing protein [Sterolibacterium sp.]
MIARDTLFALREITGSLLLINAQGVIVHVNDSLTRLLDRSKRPLIGTPLSLLIHPDSPHLTAMLRQFSGSGEWMAGRLILCNAQGLAIEFPCQGKVLQRPKAGQNKLVVIRQHALTGFVSMAQRLQDVRSEARKRHDAEYLLHLTSFAVDHAGDAMFWVDPEAHFINVNDRACQWLGYSREELTAMRVYDIDPDCTTNYWHDAWNHLKTQGRHIFERTLRRKDGSQFSVEIAASYMNFQGRELFFAINRDLTERKKAEQTINELAFYDQLTGLPNRTLLLDRLKQAMSVTQRNATSGAVLLIDLDDFKTLNDAHGHEMGDLLLCQVAQRLNESVREGDSIARFGGDEFIAVIGGLPTSPQAAAAACESIAHKILDTLTRPYTLGTLPHHASASIGVVLFQGERIALDEVIRQAELAMYKSKEGGRHTIRFFDPTLESTVQERATLERDLRQALAENHLQLHYQAQIADGRIVGTEALVRWRHPQRGMVSPAQFIPLAEETGLILPLGRRVLEIACTTLAAWAKQPRYAHLSIAVNVSARQFRQAGFVAEVLGIIDQTGIHPQRLKLELTESLLVDKVDEVIEKMFALKARGVSFSLDDFGTGYSSLAYLKRLPLDQLKIDQSFVRDVLTDPNDASIARTIIALGQNLGFGVIAEGVETEAQRQFLAQANCHAYQGYLFGKPMPLTEFEASVQTR